MAAPNEARAGANQSYLGRLGGYLGKWVPAIVWSYWSKEGPTTPVRNGASEAAHLDSILPINHPNLFMGTLQEAVAYAKSSHKFVVVYLHSESHQDSQNFVDKVFCNQTVIEVLNRNYVVWGGDVSLPGPHLVSVQLPIDGFPALCVYAPSNFVPRSHMAVLNDAHVSLPLQLYKLADTCNNTDLEDVLHMLTGVVDQYGGWISAIRRNAREAAANRQLLEDQDNAYQTSLRRDEERAEAEAAAERERMELDRLEQIRLEEDRLAEERRVLLEQEEMERATAELVASREIAAQRIGPEPPADDPDAISITFRALDSSRVTRRFRKTDTVEHLYDFCKTLESSPPSFSLTTPYPRRTFTNMQQELGELNINKALLSIEIA